MNWIMQPWPWYVAGPLIGLSIPALLLLANKTLGVSSSFRHMCSIAAPNSKLEYLRSNKWQKEIWSLVFVASLLVGGFIANYFLTATPVQFLPDHYYTLGGAMLLFVGGLLIGFGARYADGCTSGHAIMGIANLKWPSLVATAAFFVGGVVMTMVTSVLF
ncbi:MAG: YeeE/YedE family protein [Caldilineaceae bacterium]|nr:YeeE/YedE family protein [Caldilineaceae bacterium]